MTNRWGILALIMAAQTMANVGPLGIPGPRRSFAIASGYPLPQAGSFLSAYYIGPSLMSLPAGPAWPTAGAYTATMVMGQVLIALGLFAVTGANQASPCSGRA